jgi:hypothetical protein
MRKRKGEPMPTKRKETRSRLRIFADKVVATISYMIMDIMPADIVIDYVCEKFELMDFDSAMEAAAETHMGRRMP